MKSKLSRSKTDKNYGTNKYNLPNLKTLNFKSMKKSKYKALKIKTLSNNNIFSFDEEYVSNLKYKISELNLSKEKKSIYSDPNMNPHFPNINKRNSINNKIFEIKNFYKEDNKDEMGFSKYAGKQENIYKENTLENKRNDIEIKINKIKALIESLSLDLKKTLEQIDNYKLDIDVIKNADFSEINYKKKYISNLISNRSSIVSNINDINTSKSTEKIKHRDIDNMIKLEKMKLQKKKVELIEKLVPLESKRNNILIKLEYCSRNLKDLKEHHLIIKNQLINHYHKLLLEGKDTRSEGLSWIIRAIWKLKTNVIMSYLPKFLDNQSIEFLFKYSDKLLEIDKIQKNIEKKNKILKKMGKK